MPAAAAAKSKPAPKPAPIDYARKKGVDAFVDRVAEATPMQVYEAELRGVDGHLLKDLAKRMDIPAVRLFQIIGIPKATAERKAAAEEPITGAAGQAALGLTRLLALARGIVADSTAAEAKDFDAARWLGRWLEQPQPALGGRKPADLIAMPTGLEMVARLLGAIESGTYQ
jgi:putative toxin-antitoxin system antitoxin component (TIGR02293 family)